MDGLWTLAESVQDALFLLRPGGEVVWCNPAALDLCGLQEVDPSGGLRLQDLVEPGSRDEVTWRLASHDDGHSEDGPYLLRLRSGRRPRWVELRTRTVPGPPDAPRTVAAVARDVSIVRRAVAGQHLVQRLARMLEEATDFDTALGTTLREICETTGWAYAEAWVPDGDRLRCSEAWCTRLGDAVARFRHLTTRMRPNRGEGLAGIALRSPEPLRMADLATDARFDRAGPAVAAGLTAGLAVPVRQGDEAVAVMVFLHTREREEDADWVEAAVSAAGQLAAALGQLRRKHRQRQRLRLLEAQCDASGEGVLLVDAEGRVAAVNRVLLDMVGVRYLGDGSPLRHSGEELESHLSDPKAFREQVARLYEAKGSEVVLAGRRYRRTMAALRDEDDLDVARAWRFQETEG